MTTRSTAHKNPPSLAPAPKPGDRTDALAAEKLLGLLASLFEVPEFRMWIHLGPDGSAILSRLPEGSYTASQFFYEAVRVLHSHGHLGQEFFERLIQVRPKRADEIRAIDMAGVRRTLTKGFRPHPPESKTRIYVSIAVVTVLVIGNSFLVAYIAGIGPFLVVPPPVEDKPSEPVKLTFPVEPPSWFPVPKQSPPPPPPEIQQQQKEMKEVLLKISANPKNYLGADLAFDAYLWTVGGYADLLGGFLCPNPDECTGYLRVDLSQLDAQERELAFRSQWSEGSEQPILTFRGKYRRVKHQGEVLFISSVELKRREVTDPSEVASDAR